MGVVSRDARVIAVAALTAAAVVTNAAVGETLRGTVLDRTGAPAGGALVWAVHMQTPAPLDHQEATANDRGQFAMQLGPGRWQLWARRGDEGGRVTVILDLTEGREPQPVTIHLGTPSRLHGSLLDATTRRPMTGGRLALDDHRTVAIDPEGRFSVPAL